MGLRIIFQAQTIKVQQCSFSVENNMRFNVPILIFSFSLTESPYFWIFSSSENTQNLDRYQRKSALAGSHFEVKCQSRSMSTKSIACRTPNLLQCLALLPKILMRFTTPIAVGVNGIRHLRECNWEFTANHNRCCRNLLCWKPMRSGMIVCGFVRNSLINIMTRGDDLSLPGLFFIKYNVFHPSETKF